ncbi:FAD-dependent oxidoreductase [Mesorhizobium sp. BR1-1-3]|uniref:FAD-dependent oxidoreductase n=1 Tax=unclassified Mesorhizobium TaxID=325217 RepID=UPI000F751DD5|nr:MULTISPECIES: FAD-dependent oxidoreductase [unclassified Mesorhizobium]RWE28895.1 MAG: FAD-dependent oxidoreductase [Mesorhizobium sp.]AZO45234.1 FAD-dependent oxidoreductase [Mesorhizobium sp. M7D.F.Ca.US.005.01.1.1]MBZ9887635.1 FAD-dependent oxidoreductase [Mesorhizobium sp. BR1-1-3]TGP87990.1 FAD-dependent oxidoreductase [Mesorhizobium sp. M8A.F.Ca.ET.218.01.1.1]TGT15788.1 FAD-dependent oxidoreductase [Mesorhizobium sp. M8A.F.Ca.ET.213.01.1.1]
MSKQIPARADVVIVGGGIVGTSIAYHLPKFGKRDVVLLERKKLTSGTTWHAAGIVGRLRPSRSMADLAKYSIDLLRRLEEETGQSTGFKQNGGFMIALDENRLELLRRSSSYAQYIGVLAPMVTPEELQEAWPLLNIDGILGALHIPENGQVNPVDYTMALAKGARQGGVSIFEDTNVTRLLKRGDRIVGVETEDGQIEANTVVLACGMWTRELARKVGVAVPLHAAEHFYMVTEPIAQLDSKTPILVISEERSYYKEDAGKLLVGIFEERGKAWATHGIPEEFEFDSLPGNYEHYENELAMATKRVPRLESAGVQTLFVGPESFTADGRYLIGPAPEVSGLFVSAGFNSSGIMSSGGMGKVVAEWVASGNSPVDMHAFALTRTMPFQANRHFMAERVTESIGIWSNMPWPGKQMKSARDVRRMPLHHELKAAGAHFGERVGWEIPLWYAPKDSSEFRYRLGRQDWYPFAREESLAVRDNVALIDQSAYAKFVISGPDALRDLNRLCANEIDAPVGKVVYTAWLNEKGGFEADLTVTRLAEDRFLVISGFADQRIDLAWLDAKLPKGAATVVQDVTSSFGLLAIMGPKSRQLLQSLSDSDLSNDALNFGYSDEINLGHVTVRASRVTFVGELGYEILVPTEMCGYLHDLIVGAGAGFGLRYAGLYAVAACRLERGYRLMGLDITADETPVEAGLGFAVGWHKVGDFIGRERVEAQRGRPPESRLVQFALEGDDAPILIGNEIIWRNGDRVGTITSGGWGFRIDRSLGMGYVFAPGGASADWLKQGSFEIEVAGAKFPAVAQLAPFYDPTGERTRM